MQDLKKPYFLFMGSDPRPERSKIAYGLARFVPSDCVGYISEGASLGISDLKALSFDDAVSLGAKSFVIGSLSKEGAVETSWLVFIEQAILKGLDIINGHHQILDDLVLPCGKVVSELAGDSCVSLYNIRHYNGELSLGSGETRSGIRVLTVGTDCSSGKMMTGLTLKAYLDQCSFPNKFVATGQTGMLISGSGIAIDTVPSDFLSGMVEYLSPSSDELTIIEGQGSLFHPSFAGVSLGLLHGAQARYIILCHNPSKVRMASSSYLLPDLKTCLDTNLKLGRLTCPEQECIGISLNTSSLSETEAKQLILSLEDEFQMPVTDPIRYGIHPIGHALLKEVNVCETTS